MFRLKNALNQNNKQKKNLSAQIIKPNTHFMNESLHEGYASFRHLLSLIKI